MEDWGEVLHLRQRTLEIFADIAFWKLQYCRKDLEKSLKLWESKEGFNPNEPRDDHGRWTDGGSSIAGDGEQLADDALDSLFGGTGDDESDDDLDKSETEEDLAENALNSVVEDQNVSNDYTPVKYPDGNPIIDPNTGRAYPMPPGMDISANIAKAHGASLGDMIQWFQHSGPMDYQRATGHFDGQYTNISNYNYGVVSAATGLPLTLSLSAAGLFNLYAGNSKDVDTIYGLRHSSVNNITQGWNDYSKWNK